MISPRPKQQVHNGTAESNGKLVFEDTREYIKDDESPIPGLKLTRTNQYLKGDPNHYLTAQGVLRILLFWVNTISDKEDGIYAGDWTPEVVWQQLQIINV